MNKNPGSLLEYASNKKSTAKKCFNEYQQKLSEYREQIAQELKISLDELHLINNPCENRIIKEKKGQPNE